MTEAQRKAVTAEALSWAAAKTPYRGHSCIKGVGVDCGQLIYGVFYACGLIPQLSLPTDYSLQVAQHRCSKEYMAIVDEYFSLIPESEAAPGDIVCYQLGRAMAHSAIIIDWPALVIHAELRHGVSGSHGINNPNLRRQHYLGGTVREFRTLRKGGM